MYIKGLSNASVACITRHYLLISHVLSTLDGILRAHKAVFSASSLVLPNKFHRNFEEKGSPTILIIDMSMESCKAFISYLYGTLTQDDFCKHRIELLRAANKYNIGGLQDACEESLIEDLCNCTENVLETLNDAWQYQLDKLKKECFRSLSEFRKIHDLKDKVNDFLRLADRKLMMKMFQEILAIWAP